MLGFLITTRFGIGLVGQDMSYWIVVVDCDWVLILLLLHVLCNRKSNRVPKYLGDVCRGNLAIFRPKYRQERRCDRPMS